METDLTPLIETGLRGLFFVLLFLFVVHAVFVTYHWFSFGADRKTSTIALAVYLTGGAVLFLGLATSLALFS